MEEKKYTGCARIPMWAKEFLDQNYYTFSDAVYYGILSIWRAKQEVGIPRCIYVRIQSRTTPRHGCLIEQPDPTPRTCMEICGPQAVDPAAHPTEIELSRSPERFT